MYKILLVDDEPFIKDVITSFIKNKKDDIKIVDYAINGIEALDYISNNPVDMVLTDIKMSEMNGIQLLEKAKEKNIDIPFIVLSSYDEFHLVSMAFKKGAADYILKWEMTSEIVLSTIERVRKEYEKKLEKNKNNEVDLFEEKNELEFNNKIEIEKKLLKKIISADKYNDSNNKEKLKDIGIDIDLPIRAFLIVKLENYKWLKSRKETHETFLRQEDYDKIMKMINSKFRGIKAFYIKENEYCFLFLSKKSKTKEMIKKTLVNLYNYYFDYFATNFELSTSAGLSEISDSLDLKELFNDACNAIEYSFIKGKGRVIYSNEYKIRKISQKDLYKKIKIFQNSLYSYNINKIEENKKKFIITKKEADYKYLQDIKKIFNSYFECLKKYFELNNIIEINYLEKKYENYLKKYGDLDEFNEWLIDVINKVLDNLKKEDPLIRKTKECLSNNYSDNSLNLGIVSEKINVNSSYLSRIFKEETNSNFTTYLNRLRMQAAVYYLKTTNMRIYEISENIGFNNTEHFSRTFKKYYGKSPNDYQ